MAALKPPNNLAFPIRELSPEPTAKNFIKAFGGWWLIYMSGPLSVPFALAGALWPDGLGRFLAIGAAFVCAWAASYGLWRLERERTRQLEDRLISKARIYLDPIHKGIEKFRTPGGTSPKYVQFTVECQSNAPLLKCQAKLYKIERLNDDGISEIVLSNFVNCIWDNSVGTQNQEISIHPGVPQRANLFAVGENSTALETQFVQQRQKAAEEMQKPGSYRLRIAVVTDELTENASFLFHWGGSYNDIFISQES